MAIVSHAGPYYARGVIIFGIGARAEVCETTMAGDANLDSNTYVKTITLVCVQATGPHFYSSVAQSAEFNGYHPT